MSWPEIASFRPTITLRLCRYSDGGCTIPAMGLEPWHRRPGDEYRNRRGAGATATSVLSDRMPPSLTRASRSCQIRDVVEEDFVRPLHLRRDSSVGKEQPLLRGTVPSILVASGTGAARTRRAFDPLHVGNPEVDRRCVGDGTSAACGGGIESSKRAVDGKGSLAKLGMTRQRPDRSLVPTLPSRAFSSDLASSSDSELADNET